MSSTWLGMSFFFLTLLLLWQLCICMGIGADGHGQDLLPVALGKVV